MCMVRQRSATGKSGVIVVVQLTHERGIGNRFRWFERLRINPHTLHDVVI